MSRFDGGDVLIVYRASTNSNAFFSQFVFDALLAIDIDFFVFWKANDVF
jgi:hypothetical protein